MKLFSIIIVALTVSVVYNTQYNEAGVTAQDCAQLFVIGSKEYNRCMEKVQ